MFVTYTSFSSTQTIVTPHIAPRSQGVNLPRHTIGWLHETHVYGCNSFYGSLSIIPTYNRSFNGDHLAECLFGQSLGPCNTITVSGSQVPDRNERDWLADYFYLPTDFQSTLRFNPVIDNFIIDANLYFGFDDWAKGFYCILYLPIVHSRWNLNFYEQVENSGVNDYRPGYITSSTQGVPRNQLLKNMTQFMSGRTISPSENETHVIFEPLNSARILEEKNIVTRIADVRVNLGWDAVNNECGRFGFYFQGAAPTGNKPDADVLFEAIVGNGHHWEFGGGINGCYRFWYSVDESSHWELYGDATVTHFFEKEQTSTFDLKGKPLSRYMLAEKMTTPSKNLKAGETADDAIAPQFQFDNEFAPLANVTTFPVDVKIDAQVDMVIILNYSNPCLNIDLGYNFWARSCEKITPVTRFEPVANLSWALKGDAQVFGFARGDDGTDPVLQTIALSATESKATIHQGTNKTPSNQEPTNPGIDTPQPAFATSTNPFIDNNPLNAVPTGPLAQINTSVIPQILAPDDIEFVGTRGSSNKFFAHVHYQITKRNSGWIPFIGFGGEVEFANSTKHECGNDKCSTCEQPCVTCAVSQWGIWVKGGASFG
jgi:hypothetical protein